MRILAIETSVGNCTVALREGNRVLLSISQRKTSQSEELVPRINALLEASSLKYQNLDMIACTTGPGSFTGIRVGIATARGIKKAIPHIRTIGISTLELIAFCNGYNKSLIALQSYGNTFYAQEFEMNCSFSKEIYITNHVNLIQNPNDKAVVYLNEAHKYINAYNILRLVHSNSSLNQNSILTPIYAQQPNIHIKKNV